MLFACCVCPFIMYFLVKFVVFFWFVRVLGWAWRDLSWLGCCYESQPSQKAPAELVFQVCQK